MPARTHELFHRSLERIQRTELLLTLTRDRVVRSSYLIGQSRAVLARLAREEWLRSYRRAVTDEPRSGTAASGGDDNS